MQMFEDCTGLTEVPDLPATNLAEYCYSEMFRGCTSLKKWSGVTTSLKANTSNEGYFTSTSSVRIYRALTKAYEKYNCE